MILSQPCSLHCFLVAHTVRRLQVGAEEAMNNHTILKPPVLRALQQTVNSVGFIEVTYVATTEELFTALFNGARHITILQHLDLTTTVEELPLLTSIIFKSSTLSFRVRP
jgi:hypothetical protein